MTTNFQILWLFPDFPSPPQFPSPTTKFPHFFSFTWGKSSFFRCFPWPCYSYQSISKTKTFLVTRKRLVYKIYLPDVLICLPLTQNHPDWWYQPIVLQLHQASQSTLSTQCILLCLLYTAVKQKHSRKGALWHTIMPSLAEILSDLFCISMS